MADHVLAGSQGRGNGRRPAVVVSDELAHAPETGGQVTGNKASLIDLELLTGIDGEPSRGMCTSREQGD